MNKQKLIGTAMCLVLCTDMAKGQPSVQVYGRLNTSAERMRMSTQVEGASHKGTRLSNNRSVFGFRGSEELSDDLQVVYQIEGSLAPDTGSGAIGRRNTRIGLQDRYGTLFVGHWSTAYSAATSGLDPFYATTATYSNIIGNGSAASTDHITDTVSFDRRQAKSLHYWTPSWDGAQLRLTHGLSESLIDGGTRSLNSIAAIVERGQWYFALAHEIHRNYQGAGLDDTGSKLGLAYRMDSTRVGWVVERLEYQTTSGELGHTAWFLTVTHQMGAHSIHAAYARANAGRGSSIDTLGFARAGPDTSASHITIGYEYALSKCTALHTYLTHLDNALNGVRDFGINELGAEPGASLSGFTIGLRHSF